MLSLSRQKICRTEKPKKEGEGLAPEKLSPLLETLCEAFTNRWAMADTAVAEIYGRAKDRRP